MRNKQVVVIGASDDCLNFETAYQIGRFISQRGCALISGGRGGIMEAASKGAFDNGGVVVGILPDDDLDNANDYCTVVIPTGIGFARNSINVLSADLIIAIGGKAGTLSELAFAWVYRKPIICCTFTEGWSNQFPNIRVDDREGGAVYSADSIDEVFSYVDQLLNES